MFFLTLPFKGISLFKNKTKNLFILYRGIANECCCDSFWWTAKGLSHTHTCVPSPPISPPVQASRKHWAEPPVPNRRALLLFRFKRGSVCMSFSKGSPYTIISPINPLKNLHCKHLRDSYTLHAPQTRGEWPSGRRASTLWIMSSYVHTRGYEAPLRLQLFHQPDSGVNRGG